MTLWIVIAGMTAVALAMLLLPMIYRPVRLRPRQEYDLGVFNSQLAEVDRDIELGVLSAEHGEAIRLEVRRRILSSAAVQEEPAPNGERLHTLLAIAVVVFVPVASLALYEALGSPTIPDQPFAQAQAARLGGGHDMSAIEAMVAKLSERLKTTPDDPDGWMMLGRSYRTLGRNDDAVKALRKAVEQAPDSAVARSALGEAIAASSGGMIVPEAREALLSALRLDAQEPRARYFLGLARAQIGDAAGAIAVWKDLERTSPADAPWLGQVRQKITELATASKIDPLTIAAKGEMDLAGTAAPMPAADSGAGAVKMEAPHGSNANDEVAILKRVESLAAKLESNPDDAAGWTLLGRSYRALGDNTKAQQAYDKAIRLSPKDVSIRLAYAETLVSAVGTEDHLPEPFVAVMREILTLDQDQADALYYVGLAEAQADYLICN
ncbi:MAG: c-type cytochrome biogenesis protein CcmI [Alphaproteobacteria bacterium]